MSFSVEETIDASPAEVWRHLTEPALMQKWMTGIDALRSHDGRPLEANSRIAFTARGGERTSKVVAYEHGKRIALRSIQGPITATYAYGVQSFNADGTATRVTLDAECTARGPARIVAPLIGVLMRKADQGQLARLKGAVMGSSSA